MLKLAYFEHGYQQKNKCFDSNSTITRLHHAIENEYIFYLILVRLPLGRLNDYLNLFLNIGSPCGAGSIAYVAIDTNMRYNYDYL